MARVHLLLCLALLFASVTLFDVASAFLKLKPSLPQIEDPKTVGDVEEYTVKVVMVFVGDLEKECPKTSKFKAFFDKLRGFAKYVCPLKIFGKKDDADMKAKEAGILKTIASFAIGKIKREIQEEKQEAIETFKFMKSLAGRILGGRKKEEKATTALTAEQLKEIKDGILKWQTTIVKITNTMVVSTSTSESSETTTGGSESTTGGSSGPNAGSSTGSPSNKPEAGSNPGAGTPSNKPEAGSNPGAGTPSNKPEAGSNPGAGTPSEDTDNESEDTTNTASTGTETGGSTGPNSGSSTGSPSKKPAAGSNPGAGTPSQDTNNESEDTTNAASTSTATQSTSQTKEVTVTEVETQTSQQVMTFIMNLEKKSPQKEEYKQFFEKLKSTMTGKVSSPKKKGGLFAMIKGAVGKIGDAMQFIRSRLANKSAEVKKSMETYQAEVIKNMEELDAIYAKIVAENQNKKGGAMTCTPEQQAQIKTTITKWEQVTTQFVEVAIKSETSTSTSTSSSTGTAQAN
ncbi:hypothetical protein Rs2_02449 [Raphanus sativus]|uniref:Uncharacterized protein LOC108840152 n=1 Tax=Raphanus sativus TaxID=3726 RepID=A0A6J0M7J8_RAPSA|nr:uncharacterized protein LOC108840152 [Raphanus sativus]KAJ4916899.1 hypothetical protein Rs2_02449 [Raphanus sativus]